MKSSEIKFYGLRHYINKGRVKGDEYYFKHNVYGNKPHNIVHEFMENSKVLKKRKNGNVLYHQIISIKYQVGYSREQLREILHDISKQYIKARADNCLVYGVIHEQHNQIHSHLMISANEIGNIHPLHFSKEEFNKTIELTRDYTYNKYPQLEREEKRHEKTNEKPKQKVRGARTRTHDNEYQLKKRTGKKSDKDLMRERLQCIFAKSSNSKIFIQALEDEKVRIYQRGKTFGFLDEATGKKYRLKTLGLENEFMTMSNDFMTMSNDFKDKTNEQKQADNEYIQKPFDETKENTQQRKTKTRKDYMHDKLKDILSNSKSYNDFITNLEKEKIRIYRVGESFGFVDEMTNYKYRLETLKLEE